MSSVDLASAPVTPTPYGRWQPLNAALGLTGAGVSAIVCDPGEEFDIEHDEAETGQQEVYVVVAGRAEFTIGDERIEAAPGTVVAAPDPAATRNYRALEPGTRIVCLGVPGDAGGGQSYGTWISEAAEG
jgi:uncharacterized cupin superfamily protein